MTSNRTAADHGIPTRTLRLESMGYRWGLMGRSTDLEIEPGADQRSGHGGRSTQIDCSGLKFALSCSVPERLRQVHDQFVRRRSAEDVILTPVLWIAGHHPATMERAGEGHAAFMTIAQ